MNPGGVRPLICFDVDGTLLDTRDRIHPRDAAILSGVSNGFFPAWLVPATGRPLLSVKRMFARRGLFENLPLPLPLVLQNGAALYRPGEQLETYATFEPGIQDHLMEVCFSHPQVTFLLHCIDTIHMLWPHPYGIQAARRYDFDWIPFDPAARVPPYSKVMCLSLQHEDLKAVSRAATRAAGELAVEQAFSMPSILEFTPVGTNKGEGFARLKTALGLDGAPVLAAGDGGNDLALFEQASLAFAPRTSPPDIQARADRVIDVEEEGLLAPMLRAAGIQDV